MAIIQCTECTKNVSDKDFFCSHCGQSLNPTTPIKSDGFIKRRAALEIQAVKNIGKTYTTLSYYWIMIILLLFGFALLFSYSGVWTINLMGVIPLGLAYYVWRRGRNK